MSCSFWNRSLIYDVRFESRKDHSLNNLFLQITLCLFFHHSFQMLKSSLRKSNVMVPSKYLLKSILPTQFFPLCPWIIVNSPSSDCGSQSSWRAGHCVTQFLAAEWEVTQPRIGKIWIYIILLLSIFWLFQEAHHLSFWYGTFIPL